MHQAKIEEVLQRFGREPEIRRAQMESLAWLLDAARRAGVLRVIIDGSFVTDAYEPNDADCILLLGADYPKDARRHASLRYAGFGSRVGWLYACQDVQELAAGYDAGIALDAGDTYLLH